MSHSQIKVNYTLPQSSKNLYRTLFYGLLLPSIFLLIYIHQMAHSIQAQDISYIVQKSVWQFDFEAFDLLYVYINIGTIIFPFLLSFDKKVHFYKKWKFVFPAILLNGIFFILWDIYFTKIHVWGFNDKFIFTYILGLPLGEWLFFITVPYACIFLHNCLTTYIQKDILQSIDKPFSLLFSILLIVIGLLHSKQIYTLWAFVLAGTFLLCHYIFIPNTYRTKYYFSFLIILIPFTIVNGLLTGLFTVEPVVVYNEKHHLIESIGRRFLSIPIDDFIYAFLLLFIPVTLFEQLKTTYKNQQ